MERSWGRRRGRRVGAAWRRSGGRRRTFRGRPSEGRCVSGRWGWRAARGRRRRVGWRFGRRCSDRRRKRWTTAVWCTPSKRVTNAELIPQVLAAERVDPADTRLAVRSITARTAVRRTTDTTGRRRRRGGGRSAGNRQRRGHARYRGDCRGRSARANGSTLVGCGLQAEIVPRKAAAVLVQLTDAHLAGIGITAGLRVTATAVAAWCRDRRFGRRGRRALTASGAPAVCVQRAKVVPHVGTAPWGFRADTRLTRGAVTAVPSMSSATVTSGCRRRRRGHGRYRWPHGQLAAHCCAAASEQKMSHPVSQQSASEAHTHSWQDAVSHPGSVCAEQQLPVPGTSKGTTQAVRKPQNSASPTERRRESTQERFRRAGLVRHRTRPG